ncbi:MAG: cupredoxin domain-containing protein [Methermicoccaceae archaeon]
MKRALIMLLVLSVALGVFVAGCAQQPESAAPEGTPTAEGGAPAEGASQVVEVMIENNTFIPSTLTIPVGTTVKWTNFDKVKHTVTSDNGIFNSGEIAPGEEYEYPFETKHAIHTPLEFPYKCTLYPSMKGKIVVTAAPTAGGGAPAEGASQVVEVLIESYTFMPSTVTVKVGTTVKWTNFDKVKHRIVSKGGIFDSDELNTGDTFEHTFNKTGEYLYTSVDYPSVIAKIIVEE